MVVGLLYFYKENSCIAGVVGGLGPSGNKQKRAYAFFFDAMLMQIVPQG